jgi:2-polyprenyl-3-methyl-5-hydroxy-6-metoxy-1,4-benzoquinol methylase
MLHHASCLVCSSTRLTPLSGYERAHLCRCGACGFVFAQRIPTEQELNQFYSGYGSNNYLSPLTIKRYHELLDKMEPFRKTNKLMDVGCGNGFFLEVAKERGWEVYGTEYAPRLVEICQSKGINMQQGKLDPTLFENESFDVITSFEVLEHINTPREEIAHFYQLLRKGGLVYLTTPNFNSLLRYKLKSQYNVIAYPEHLSYYTPRTLSKLFRTSGFKPLKIQTTGISLTRLRTSQGKTKEAYISKTSTDEQIRTKIDEKNYLQLAKRMANGALTLFGVGDSLKGWFVKG